MDGVPDARAAAARAFVAARDPELLAAANEVDPALLDWARSLSPRERLEACSRAARALAAFRHVASEDR